MQWFPLSPVKEKVRMRENLRFHPYPNPLPEGEGVLSGRRTGAYLAAGTMFQKAVVPNGLGSMTHSSIEFGL